MSEVILLIFPPVLFGNFAWLALSPAWKKAKKPTLSMKNLLNP